MMYACHVSGEGVCEGGTKHPTNCTYDFVCIVSRKVDMEVGTRGMVRGEVGCRDIFQFLRNLSKILRNSPETSENSGG